jgi:CRISPR-associated protein Cas5h
LYVSHEDQAIFEDLVKKVKNHEAVFTPSLGLSELLAFHYQKVIEVEEREEERVADLVTVVPLPYLEGLRINFEGGKKYFKERIPVRMNEERVVEEYQEVIFESKANLSRLKPGRAGKVRRVEDFSFSNLYSHPGKYLEEHLIRVAKIALTNWEAIPITVLEDSLKVI